MSGASGVDYESGQLVSEYLHFHYAAPEEIFPWGTMAAPALDYAVRVVTERFPRESAGRGLDVGCAVGRSSFEMAKHCSEVIGVDYSAAFVGAAERIRTGGKVSYRVTLQGERSEEFEARRPAGVDSSRVRFEVGDAHDLGGELGRFDWILGANLLCRLHHPRRFLDQLPDLLNPGGWLVLNSPFTWMAEYTDPSEWIGARKNGGDSATELKRLLEDDFEFVDETSMPFLIRETERKYQLTFAHSGRWRRR